MGRVVVRQCACQFVPRLWLQHCWEEKKGYMSLLLTVDAFQYKQKPCLWPSVAAKQLQEYPGEMEAGCGELTGEHGAGQG